MGECNHSEGIRCLSGNATAEVRRAPGDGRILHKPGPLSAEEVEIMREHCYRGYQMLRKIPFLSEASEIVYAHQECWDGSGYPRGLKGEEIPIGARLFAIIDTLDTITSDRPYRTAGPFLSRARRSSAGQDVSSIPMLYRFF